MGAVNSLTRSCASFWPKCSRYPNVREPLKRISTVSPTSRFAKFIKNNNITLRNVALSLSTFGLEELVHAEAFNCPEESYKFYGLSFLLLPVIALFCVNLVIIGEMGTLTTRIFVRRYRRRGNCLNVVMPSLLKAGFGPIMWLIASFRNDAFYVCARFGPSPVPNNATITNETSAEEIILWEKKIQKCKSESHVIALSLLVGFVFVTSIAIVCKQCCIKDEFLMQSDHFTLEKREAVSAMQEFLKQAGGPDLEERESEVTKTKELKSIEEETGEVDDDTKTEKTDGGKSTKINVHGKICTVYLDGAPETLGRLTVTKLFEGFPKDDRRVIPEWHYVKAYAAFKQMYPRITTGNPLDPWRKLEGDRSRSQRSWKHAALLFQCFKEKKDEKRCQQLNPIFYDAEVNQFPLNGGKEDGMKVNGGKEGHGASKSIILGEKWL
ncbi:uncharacterized protein [Montipora foliosa]|uniref:uncharacterized protein isoform X1 n=1 Tax=Montipora foliosa TaxID=591990 RepID=UPI0035F156DE